MKKLKRWWFKPAYWWEFWLPKSGLIGGLIMGTIISSGLLWLK